MFVSPPSTLKMNNHPSIHPPVPYGIIPKRNKKKQQQEQEPKIISPSTCEKQQQQDMACAIQQPLKEHIAIASYFLSVFNNYFGNNNVSSAVNTTNTSKLFVNSNKGLMPHTPTRKSDAYITPQTVTTPITMASVCDTDQDESWDYLSKSDSSTSSAGSSFSSISSHSITSSISSRQRKSVSSLSEILCEHYVQKTLHSSSNSNYSSSNDEIVDVPLETYKVFEASRRRSSSGNSFTLKKDDGSNNECNENEQQDDDDEEDESWFIWDNLQKTKEWIQVIDEELFLPKEKVTTEITIAVEQPSSSLLEEHKKVRGIRANPAHLRMIVAEVNMMRCNKIVGPLRPRGFLPARKDTFVSNCSSPLVKLSISNAADYLS